MPRREVVGPRPGRVLGRKLPARRGCRLARSLQIKRRMNPFRTALLLGLSTLLGAATADANQAGRLLIPKKGSYTGPKSPYGDYHPQISF